MTNEYQDRANYYKNLHFLDDTITAVVHLEDEEDRLFWEPMLSKYGKGSYKFIYHTRENNIVGGCEECLKYKAFLSPYFFVCIDSDMRYIMQEQDINVQHYICQTYTYSIENHFCEKHGLQTRFSQCIQDFNFEDFLSDLSRIIYKPLLLLIHNMRNNLITFGVREFRTCVPHQCTRNDLGNNGKNLLDKINANFCKYNVEDENLSIEAKMLKSLNITPENAYLHMRGHDLGDLVSYIGNMFFQHIQGISFKNDIYYSFNNDANYWEMRKIIADIQELNEQQN